MFARFNLLAKPLKDERPRVMTLDQLKTSYLFHLRTLITGPEELELTRDIKAAEREREVRGYEPLTCYEIHTLALRKGREGIIEQRKLRAVGLTRVSVKDRLGERPRHVKEPYQERTPENDPGKNRERERRICNNCKIRGHLARNCTLPPQPQSPDRKRTGDTKRQATDTDTGNNPPSTKARTAATEYPNRYTDSKQPSGSGRRGGGRQSGTTNRGGRSGGRPPYVKHTTGNATCSHCGFRCHTVEQCWTLHEELRPPRREKVKLVNVKEENMAANRRWEAEQLAREESSRKYERERDTRESRRNGDDDDNNPRMQYMVCAKESAPSGAKTTEWTVDPAAEAERELQWLDAVQI